MVGIVKLLHFSLPSGFQSWFRMRSSRSFVRFCGSQMCWYVVRPIFVASNLFRPLGGRQPFCNVLTLPCCEPYCFHDTLPRLNVTPICPHARKPSVSLQITLARFLSTFVFLPSAKDVRVFAATMFDPFVKCHARRADRELDIGDIVGKRNLYKDIFDMVRRNLTTCVLHGMFPRLITSRFIVCSRVILH